MKFIKQDLLTLLIGLFLFSSCKDSNTIGLDLGNTDLSTKGTLVDTVSINLVTQKEDPISTVAQDRYPLGYLNSDVQFGTTEASLAMTVTLPSNGYSFGTAPVIDSAILILPYSTQFYGDTTSSVYNINVQQLASDLSVEKSFLSNKEWAVQGGVIGNYNARIKPKTPIVVNTIVDGGPDTAATVVPQLRIKLSNSFIQNNILNLDSITRSKNTRFATAFKGLHVSINKTGSTGKGGIIFLNFGSTSANLELHYKKQDATVTTERDTVSVLFPVSSTLGPIASTIKHNYTGTKVQEQLDAPNPAVPYSVTYLQAMAGLRNKISFPYLKKFVETVKAGKTSSKIIVNRAELIINLNNGTDVSPLNAAQRLSLYRLDIGGLRGNVPDNDTQDLYRYAGSETAFGGFFDATNNRYIFTITSYLQDLIDGKTEDYGTFIAPSSLTEFNIAPSITSAARSIINTRFPGTDNKAIKLNIYYTKVD
ncbi:DUF4270 domain-containing protein [Pedobacter metabolipauper]|uniref:Uncharacterized protein DUF4270 n=1 Tax=Pedobacter metabolipauper TaxID=425513 RepID=A0A4R6SVJ8_9SPHI|nr:DUF4270 domain-containing protein [Pedobacter metabolipauper]TDQ09376.1 uncharacterized protein DUF4270 [Pedobacter metabolipauper]